DKDWLQWTENIMMDRDVTYLRPKVPPHLYDNSSAPRLRFFVLLARLRKVVLQDAVALMDINTDSLCDYSKHHIFRLPLFDDPQFHQFRIDLRKSMATTVSLHSLKLNTVTPLISHEIKSVNHLVTNLFDGVYQRLDNMERTLTDTQSVSQLTMVPTRTIHDHWLRSPDDHQMYHGHPLLGDLIKMLRQARLEKQPIGRSTGLATLSNSGPSSNPHVPVSSNTIVSTDQTITDGYSISMRNCRLECRCRSNSYNDILKILGQLLVLDYEDATDRLEHDDEMGVSGSTNTPEDQLDNGPAASIHLMSPGPGEDYVMLPRDAPLRDHWKEWFYGKDPTPPNLIRPPSLYQLNKYYKTS
ncbi:hypothetical protein FBU30_009054, partial [Linnemannia zychae]